MNGPEESKSRGLKFAEQLMQNQGWKPGQGLGKKEDGISEAIKVKIKCGKAGVGHDSAEQFTFHWWDHIFNKTASNIDVQIGKDGAQMNKLAKNDVEITNKKPRKGLEKRNMLYGRFIKSATLLSGGEQPAEKPSSSDSSDSSGDEEKLDLSSGKTMTDEELIRACGGRTAHKGARHGLNMSAKLARLEEQEQEFLAKYGKKDQKVIDDENGCEAHIETENIKHKKKKLKKLKERHACSADNFEADSLDLEMDSTKKKKKQKKKTKDFTAEEFELNKSKKRDRTKQPNNEPCSETDEHTEDQMETTGVKQKKRKKKRMEEAPEEQEEIPLEILSKKKKKKRKLQED